MNEIVLMSDPRVAAIPVAECGERLVDVRRSGSLLVDARQQDPADAFAYLRGGVLDRLLKAQAMLPQGLRLLFVEGYRPPSLQREYFEEYAGFNCASATRSGPAGRSTRRRAAMCPRPTSPRTAPGRPSTSPWPTEAAGNWIWAHG